MLKASGLKKSYSTLPVLKGVNLEIQKGEVVAIVGASGAGKSTLLHILGSLDIPDEGGVEVNGTNLFNLSTKSLAEFRNKNLGFVFQFHNLLPAQYRLTVEAARFRKEAVTITLRPDETFATPAVKLTPSSLHVAVLDAGSQPLPGVTVSLYTKERAVVGARAARSITDQYGDAYFGKLAPGSFQLSATLRGYDEYRNDVFISSGITTEFPLQLLVAPVIPINEKAVSRYTVPNLPSKNVQAAFQDSEGWMWFGTDKGVARFNGAEFKSSAVAGSAFELLAGEDVRSITEDRNGTIWIATARGLRRITKVGEDCGPAFDVHEPRQVLVDSGNTIWVAGAHGLSRFDGRALIPFAHSRELPSDDVRALAEDTSGSLWIATANGVAIFEGEKLLSFQRWRESHGARNQSEDQSSIVDVRSIFVDTAGRVWLATASDLLLVERGSVQRPAIEAMRSTSGSHGGSPRAIGADLSGRMWFGESIQAVVSQRDAEGLDSPLFFERVGSPVYFRKDVRL